MRQGGEQGLGILCLAEAPGGQTAPPIGEGCGTRRDDVCRPGRVEGSLVLAGTKIATCDRAPGLCNLDVVQKPLGRALFEKLFGPCRPAARNTAAHVGLQVPSLARGGTRIERPAFRGFSDGVAGDREGVGNRRRGGTGTLWLAQNGETMDAACLRVVRMGRHPGAQLCEFGAVFGWVQVPLRLDMSHQATVLDARDDRVRGFPITRFLEFEDPFVSRGVGDGQYAFDGSDAGYQHCSRTDQRGLERSRLGLLCMRSARPCE